MARKLKHSKIKNTSILFELLTRQITADVLAGKSTKSVKIVKKYFNENTELGKELEHITSKKISSEEAKAHVLKEYNKTDKDLRLLAYQILVDKFNTKYKTLNESQKSLLEHYINNISNTNSLKQFVDTESSKIEKELKKHLPKVNDTITKIKLTEAVNQIDNMTKGKLVKEKQVLTLMRYYELVKEIENVHKS